MLWWLAPALGGFLGAALLDAWRHWRHRRGPVRVEWGGSAVELEGYSGRATTRLGRKIIEWEVEVRRVEDE